MQRVRCKPFAVNPAIRLRERRSGFGTEQCRCGPFPPSTHVHLRYCYIGLKKVSLFSSCLPPALPGLFLTPAFAVFVHATSLLGRDHRTLILLFALVIAGVRSVECCSRFVVVANFLVGLVLLEMRRAHALGVLLVLAHVVGAACDAGC